MFPTKPTGSCDEGESVFSSIDFNLLDTGLDGETAYAPDIQLVEFVLCGLPGGIGDIDKPPVDAIAPLLAFAI
ncbi:MAG: hypothetical protein P8Y82_06050, partial [Methyloceanibacter sp.]